MQSSLVPIVVAVAVAGISILGIIIMFARCYRKIPPNHALIINTPNGAKVSMRSYLVLPIIHRADVLDLTVKTIAVDRRGKDAPQCKDGIRADMALEFAVRVNSTDEDILKVARTLGAERASDPAVLEDLLVAKFCEAIKTVVAKFEFEELISCRDDARDHILQVIGEDLNGLVLDDVAISSIEMTPIEQLDANNILDAAGIRKITEITARHDQDKHRLLREQRIAELQRERDKAADEAKHQFDLIALKAQALVDALAFIAEQEGRLSDDARQSLAAVMSESTVDDRSTSQLAADAQSELDRMRADSEAALASLRLDETDSLSQLQSDGLSVLDSTNSDLSDG